MGATSLPARHRRVLEQHGFIGSMSRKGNPYDNAKAESFMKSLKVEAVYIAEYGTFEDVAVGLPVFIETSTTRPVCIPLWGI